MLIPLAIAGGAYLGGKLLDRYGQSEANQAYADTMNPYLDQYQDVYQDQFDWTQDAYQPQIGYSQEALGDMWSGIRSGEFIPEQQDFDWSGYDVDTYLDPSMAYEQEQQRKALEASYGGSGLLSGAAMKELQGRSMDIARTGYGQAFDRMRADRGDKYAEFVNSMARNRQNMQDRLSQLSGIVNLGQTGLANVAGARGNLAQATGQAALQRGQLASGVAADDASFWSDIGSGALGAVGQMAGMSMAAPNTGNITTTSTTMPTTMPSQYSDQYWNSYAQPFPNPGQPMSGNVGTQAQDIAWG